MPEVGLAILIVGSLVVIDQDRLSWLADKVRELFEWLSS
jgi:hypothetical protein